MWLTFTVLLLVLVVLALAARRQLDHRADRDAMEALASLQPGQPARFSPDIVAGLPEPARRYFLYTIEPGAPLYTIARITMTGRFGLGTRASPGYLDFSAIQALAMPEGFLWKMRGRRGVLRLSGSDSEHWTRFWMMGLLPVARLGGDEDHRRSAFGRYVAEALFWTPAATLPGPGISWEQVGADSVRLTVVHQGLSQSVELTVAPDGEPTQVRFERWSNANPEKQYRLQPFGGYLSGYRWFSGFRLPTHVEAGNHFGGDQYFPFFVAEVAAVEFPRD
ncbi:hypothetical protein SAMN05216203_1841 [Marinobacter daqiaonensis]|uniref:Uncharacterized protein n=1 Tax=Marinobacter daqiaonensis TaxID=650891 RepID=A0A1I6I5C7_9GAMM|nr:DUF6544 family protein [Marinobacter daqiaonensis]SFR61922.1 hypothetical protein SAMN05216203_1841 [Marinobacter daqiaonensis]